MSLGRGIQAEVTLSLAVIMMAATALLVGLFIKSHTAQMQQLERLVGLGLVADVRSQIGTLGGRADGVEWWTLSPDARIRPERQAGGMPWGQGGPPPITRQD